MTNPSAVKARESVNKNATMDASVSGPNVKPSVSESTRKSKPCTSAIRLPPSTLPSTIDQRGIGTTSTDCKNPSRRSSMCRPVSVIAIDCPHPRHRRTTLEKTNDGKPSRQSCVRAAYLFHRSASRRTRSRLARAVRARGRAGLRSRADRLAVRAGRKRATRQVVARSSPAASRLRTDAAAQPTACASSPTPRRQHGLTLLVDLVIDRVSADGGALSARTRTGSIRSKAQRRGSIRAMRRARTTSPMRTSTTPRPRNTSPNGGRASCSLLADAGIGGFRFDSPHRVPAHVWRRLGAARARAHPETRLLACDASASRATICTVSPSAGFDAVFSSVRWWDFRKRAG